MSKRLALEIKNFRQKLQDEELDGVAMDIEGDVYTFRIQGSGLYSKGVFKVQMLLDGFPERCPDVHFVTPIYHPSVDENGCYCSALLNEWNATTTIVAIIEDIQDLFIRQSFPTPRNTAAAKLFTENIAEFKKTVNSYIAQHCHDSI